MTAKPSPEKSQFRLFDSFELQQDKRYSEKIAFLTYFDGSVRGLSKGAPVEFNGIRIGTVSDVHLEFDAETLKTRIPVVLELEPERLRGIGAAGPTGPYKVMAALVAKGMRAQLQSGNILTGQLFIDLANYPDAEPAELIIGGTHPEIPTVPTDIEKITQSVTEVLKKIAALPLPELVADLRADLQALGTILKSPEIPKAIASLDETLTSARSLVANLDAKSGPLLDSLRETSDKARDAISQTEVLIEAAEGVLGPESATRYNLISMMDELSQAARSIRILTDYLEQHPDALVRGKGGFSE
jgi:paraquat-inducible protein B